MLKRQFRLPAQVSFSGARSFSSSFFLFKFKKTDLPYPRFGFVVSKRVDKTAVGRNKIKRLLSNVAQEDFLQDSGYDMLVIVKKSFLLEDFDLQKAIKEGVEKLKNEAFSN